MAVPRIDKSEWPLVQVDWEGTRTVEDIDHHFDEMSALVRQGQRFGLVMRMRGFENPDAVLRRRVSQRLEAIAGEARDIVVCNAHVIRSAAVRGILTAIYWIAPPPFETRVFGDEGEAMAWARERLASSSAES